MDTSNNKKFFISLLRDTLLFTNFDKNISLEPIRDAIQLLGQENITNDDLSSFRTRLILEGYSLSPPVTLCQD